MNSFDRRSLPASAGSRASVRVAGLIPAFLLALLVPSLRAAEPAVPAAFPAARYEHLWVRSPFSVASTTFDPDSAEYDLVGVGKVDDEVYASVQDRQSGEIFVISNHHPSHNLKLFQVHGGDRPEDSFAIIGRADQTITLHLHGATPTTEPTIQTAPPPTTPIPTETLAPNSNDPHSVK